MLYLSSERSPSTSDLPTSGVSETDEGYESRREIRRGIDHVDERLHTQTPHHVGSVQHTLIMFVSGTSTM